MLLKSLPEFGEGLVIVDTPHALLDFEKAQSHPALPLVRVHPTGDFAEVPAQQPVVVLDGVRRLEGASELFEDTEQMEGQLLLQSFHERPGGAAARLLKLTVDLKEGRLSFLAGRKRPGALELPAVDVFIAFVDLSLSLR